MRMSEIFVIPRRMSEMRSKVRTVLHVKWRYYWQIVMKLELYRQSFQKYSNIKFYETPSSGSRIAACRQTDSWTEGQTDGQTDRHDKHNVRFRNFDFFKEILSTFLRTRLYPLQPVSWDDFTIYPSCTAQNSQRCS